MALAAFFALPVSSVLPYVVVPVPGVIAPVARAVTPVTTVVVFTVAPQIAFAAACASITPEAGTAPPPIKTAAAATPALVTDPHATLNFATLCALEPLAPRTAFAYVASAAPSDASFASFAFAMAWIHPAQADANPAS